MHENTAEDYIKLVERGFPVYTRFFVLTALLGSAVVRECRTAP